MATHVLVPIDGSEQSWAALDHALETFAGERITVLNVVDPMAGVYAGVDDFYDPGGHDRAVARGEELCEEALDRAEQSSALSSTIVETAVETGRPARTIVAYAEDHDVDHVVMGSHGRSGFSRILVGSVAETVMRRSPVPVTVVR